MFAQSLARAQIVRRGAILFLTSAVVGAVLTGLTAQSSGQGLPQPGGPSLNCAGDFVLRIEPSWWKEPSVTSPTPVEGLRYYLEGTPGFGSLAARQLLSGGGYALHSRGMDKAQLVKRADGGDVVSSAHMRVIGSSWVVDGFEICPEVAKEVAG
jgi:hypothetical protein